MFGGWKRSFRGSKDAMHGAVIIRLLAKGELGECVVNDRTMLRREVRLWESKCATFWPWMGCWFTFLWKGGSGHRIKRTYATRRYHLEAFIAQMSLLSHYCRGLAYFIYFWRLLKVRWSWNRLFMRFCRLASADCSCKMHPRDVLLERVHTCLCLYLSGLGNSRSTESQATKFEGIM